MPTSARAILHHTDQKGPNILPGSVEQTLHYVTISILVFAMNSNEVEKENDFFMGKTSSYFYGTKHHMKIYQVLQKESRVIIFPKFYKCNHHDLAA